MENTPETSPETVDTTVKQEDKSPRIKKEKVPLTPEMKLDPLSKKLINFSKIFAVLAISCIGFLTYVRYQKRQVVAPPKTEEVAVKSNLPIIQELKEIKVKLLNEQDLRVELAVECAEIETCDFIKDHVAQVRDLLIPVLGSFNSEQFGSMENKKLMRKKLIDQLNTLEIPGKVTQVHFNNLSFEGQAK